MSRALFGALVLLASCAEADERPLTIEYATEAILAPSCGNAQCHSSFRQADGYVFDTVDMARRSLIGLVDVGLVEDADGAYFAGDPNSSPLIEVLIRFPDRMPYDQPLPDQDIEYLRRYVADGARGAQCLPLEAVTCVGPLLFTCNDEWNYGELVEDCRLRPSSGAGFKWVCSDSGPGCMEIRCPAGDMDPQCL